MVEIIASDSQTHLNGQDVRKIIKVGFLYVTNALLLYKIIVIFKMFKTEK